MTNGSALVDGAIGRPPGRRVRRGREDQKLAKAEGETWRLLQWIESLKKCVAKARGDGRKKVGKVSDRGMMMPRMRRLGFELRNGDIRTLAEIAMQMVLNS
ncbi:hypothetical protein NL676_022183 [Syzygium grande]|nr:hypothetical protein NL676_022183 [Syzygium grande]